MDGFTVDHGNIVGIYQVKLYIHEPKYYGSKTDSKELCSSEWDKYNNDNDFEKSSLKAKKKRRPIFYQRVSLAEKVRQEKERSIEFSKF
ncbi:hypothetical protein MTR_7g111295 [Medicago truncatula]|uniref:Uncharacterized protein n=1 Tax=Medicago truncatula TaxID=3880 RepID=A0A072U3Z5_MEDTR|nr:hypothetical protein MTR_7g111295 [Medicago truncatula]